MKPIHIGTSPLTNRIFAEHVLANGGPVTVTCNGKPKFEITVRELTAGDEREEV